MPYLAPIGYAGPPLPEPIRSLLATLEERGLNIKPTGSAKKTIRISKGDRYIGYVNEFVIRHNGVMGYHFSMSNGYDANACPPGFSVTKFALLNKCSPAALDVKPDKDKTFLHLLDVNVAINIALRNGIFSGSTVSVREPSDSTLLADIAEIESDETISSTTRKALVDARLGQGKFRAMVRLRYQDQCAVSGLPLVSILRASHIKAWAKSTNEERLDPENGLLLSPNIDALFDRHLIGFSDEGLIVRSSSIDDRCWRALGDIGNLREKPSQKQVLYLRQHMAHVA